MFEIGQDVGRWRFKVLAAATIGLKRECVAQKYQRQKTTPLVLG